MILATSRYANQAAIRGSGLLPVRITLGPPRFPLAYELAAEVRMLAPTGAEFSLEWPEFAPRYLARLDHYGPVKVGRALRGVSEEHRARGLCLLCFEDVWAGERCHRRLFAGWWEARTGQAVPELPRHISEHHGTQK